MLFQAYGLFWRRDEVDWHPGKGKAGLFCLLGRRGTNLPGLKVADFRHQRGIYILYGNFGPYYVGLTRKQSLGKRLKDHLADGHGANWDRFSWFGFRRVLKRKNDDGRNMLGELPNGQHHDMAKVIGDIEALLIRSMALQNIAQMKFAKAQEWTQIKLDELDSYRKKLSAL
jgi:hypothetical protein